MPDKTRRHSGKRAVGVAAIAVGSAWIGSVWIVLAIVASLLTVTMGAVAWGPSRAAVRRCLLRRERRRWLGECADRLENAGVAEERQAAFKLLGAHLDTVDEPALARYPVHELFGDYVDLELERHRCHRALVTVTRHQLVEELRTKTGADDLEQQRRSCVEMRLLSWDECQAHLDRCERQIAVITAIVRAIELRAAVPIRALAPGSIDRAIEDLESDAEAIAEVAALDRTRLLGTAA